MGVKIVGFHGSTGKGCGCCGAPLCTCGACSLPQANLTLSWTNVFLGTGSTTLTYQSCSLWNTACVNSMLFELQCVGGVLVFTAIYFISGSCPTGQRGQCTTNGSSPSKLDGGAKTCGASFLWPITVNSDCSNLATAGWTSFTISA